MKQLSPKQGLAIAISIAAVVTIATIIVSLPKEQNAPSIAQSGKGGNSITIVTISSGSLLTGANYSITPNPYGGNGQYSIQDGSKDDSNSAAGIIVMSGVRDGNYTIKQIVAPPGYNRDDTPKTVAVHDNTGATATFSNAAAGQVAPPATTTGSAASTTQARNVLYTTKFECGTISGNEGPLRPGHYDTDIGVMNKQDFPVKFTWNAVLNNGKTTNSILKSLDPQTSTDIVCKDLRKLFGGNDKFVEGFVVVNAPLDSDLLGTLSSGTAVVGRQGSTIDLLDVQVFYTANALDVLPHEVLVDKVVFSILKDPSAKIPSDNIGKTLDITLNSTLNTISNPAELVKAAIGQKYGLSTQETTALEVKIDNISVGAGSMIDDHAISLSRVPPQASG